jgi:hypothetical protein
VEIGEVVWEIVRGRRLRLLDGSVAHNAGVAGSSPAPATDGSTTWTTSFKWFLLSGQSVPALHATGAILGELVLFGLRDLRSVPSQGEGLARSLER